MQFAALGDLHRDLFSQEVSHALGEGFSRIAAVTQQASHSLEVWLAAFQGVQRAFAIGHLGRRYRNGMGQSLRIDGDVALDPRDLLARVIALLASRVAVLHALRVHDQERAPDVAPLSLAGRANLIF